MSVKYVIQKLQSINTIKRAAAEIWKSVNKSLLILKTKFCDAEELKNFWDNALMPHELIYFFKVFQLIQLLRRREEFVDVE